MNTMLNAVKKYAFLMRLPLALISTLALILITSWGRPAPASASRQEMPQTPSEGARDEFSDNVFYGPLRKQFQVADNLISNIGYQPPPSPWLESEKKFHRSLLDGQKYDVLIVPFQTQANGVDLVGRMLMTYRLALAVARNTNLKIAPLKIVYPVLGVPARFYDEPEVMALAKRLGVSRIIWGYAGTRDYPDVQTIQLTFSIIDQQNTADKDFSRTKFKNWPYQTLAPEVLPSHHFEQHLDEVLAFLEIPNQTSRREERISGKTNYTVPESPAAMLNNANYPTLYQSYLLQMLAMLAPTDYHKTQLFTQSLTNVFTVAKNNPDRRLIEARAYLHLYRRPAALKRLEGVKTKEAAALLEYINANLPELEQKVDMLSPSIKQFLARLELFELKNEYKKQISDDEKKAFVADYPGWEYLLDIRLSHYNAWKHASNFELKLLLDQLFPIKGFSAKELAPGFQITQAGSPDQLQADLLFQKHIRLARAQLRKDPIAADSSSGLSADDLLTMLDSVGINNLLQKIYFYAFVQDIPSKGLSMCDEALRIYEGHPYFVTYKAMVLGRSLKERGAEEKRTVTDQRFDLSLNALWWNGCHNWVHRKTRMVASKVPEVKKPFIDPESLIFAIESDYPFRTNIVDYKRRPESMLMDWEHTRVYFHKSVYENLRMIPPMSRERKEYTEKASAILSDLSSRFNGNPDKVKFLSTVSVAQPASPRPSTARSEQTGHQDRKSIFLKEVESNSQDWEFYDKLAQIYIEEENYLAAQQVMLRYPKIKTPEKFDAVTVSNIAGEAGDKLFWKGAAELSKPFYQLSADLDTGSDASISGGERLAVLDHDFQTATAQALRRAKRYEYGGAYSDYMAYLHLAGAHDTAWSVFNSLLGRFKYPDIWYAASVGHRIQGTGIKQLNEWMAQMAQLSPAEKQKGRIAQFGIWFLNDLAPAPDLLDAIEAVDIPPADAMPNLMEGLKLSGGSAVAIPPQGNWPKLFHAPFARAYDLIYQKGYAEAFKILAELMDSFGWQYGNAGKTLQSYAVWAGIKSGQKELLERTIIFFYNHVTFAQGNDFDAELAYAAFEGGTGNHDKAIRHLKNAFGCEVKREERLFGRWFQLVQLCQWLYEDSHDPRYRQLALQWARSYQQIRPIYAWAYMVEAELTDQQENKIKALACAQFLCPQSRRLDGFDRSLKEKAAEWMKANNPFYFREKNGTLKKI